MPDEYFSVLGISLRFGGLQVLDDATLHVGRGEIVGIIGPNGAGKTTLFDVISGFHRPEGGRVFLDGRDLIPERPYKRAWLGLGRTFQTARLFQNMTVADIVQTAVETAVVSGGMKPRPKPEPRLNPNRLPENAPVR